MRLLLAIFVFILTVAAVPAYSAVEDAEDEMKAAVVLTFLRYSEWPSPARSNGPVIIGVGGRPGFSALLRRSLDGKTVNNRSISVIELDSAADGQGCNVIYIATGGESKPQQFLKGGRSPAGTLTISDSRDFLESGGVVRLLLVDGRITFEVSMDGLERSGITISSKLLRFGQIRRSKGGKQ